MQTLAVVIKDAFVSLSLCKKSHTKKLAKMQGKTTKNGRMLIILSHTNKQQNELNQ